MIARAVGLRIAGIRLFRRRVLGRPSARPGGPQSHINIDLTQPVRALAPRMICTVLAGPLVNLGTAAILAGFATSAGYSWAIRASAAGACVAAAVLGVANLVPLKWSGTRNDGLILLDWTFHAQRRQAQLRDQREFRAMVQASDTDVDLLRAAARSDNPKVAGPAAVRLIWAALKTAAPQSQVDALWALHGALLRVTRLPGLAPELVPKVAGLPGSMLANVYLERLLRYGTQPDPGHLAALSDLLEAGLSIAPDDLRSRTALGLVRALQDRVGEARSLLVGISASSGSPSDVAKAYAVRALAETDLGDRDQAARLIDAAERIAPGERLTAAALQYLHVAIHQPTVQHD